jgi:hypothetical protein
MSFEPKDGWYCEACNEVYPIPEGKCPQCGVGNMSDWEEGEQDAWSWSTESHYTKPSGTDYRICDNCGYEEDQEHYDPRSDPDYLYEIERDRRDNEARGDHMASYFGAKKEAAGEHPSTGEGHKCMSCGKSTPPGWGPTMCAECAKNEDKKASSYFDITKTAQWFDEAIKQPNDDPIPCNRCGEMKPDVEERDSFGIYAGKMCCECAYAGYRDHCGLIKNPDGTFSEGGQGNPAELEEMGEQVEPEDGGFYG